MHAPADPRTRFVPSRRTLWLCAVTAAIWLTVAVWHPAEALNADPRRFAEIATAPGVPYRDFPVEYAPLETAIVRFAGPRTASDAATMTLIANALATIAIVLLLRRRWGDRTAGTFLLLALPLQVFMPFRLDAVSVALCLAGIVAASRGRERLGGGLFALAVLFKLWPVVLLPSFWLLRWRRGLVTVVLGVLVGAALWVAVGGIGALSQVSSSLGATGWHVESLPGVLVAALTGAPLRGEAGAVRVGTMTNAEVSALRITTVAVLACVWWRAKQRDDVQPFGLPATAAVATLLVLSPLFSSQYVLWLLPWAAIAVEEQPRRLVAASTLAASSFAAAIFIVYWSAIRTGPLLALAFGRVAAVAVLVFLWLSEKPIRDSPVSVEHARA